MTSGLPLNRGAWFLNSDLDKHSDHLDGFYLCVLREGGGCAGLMSNKPMVGNHYGNNLKEKEWSVFNLSCFGVHLRHADDSFGSDSSYMLTAATDGWIKLSSDKYNQHKIISFRGMQTTVFLAHSFPSYSCFHLGMSV